MDGEQLAGKSSFIVLNRCTDDENNDTLNFPGFEIKMNKENFMSNLTDVESITPAEAQVILPDVGSSATNEPEGSKDVEKRLSEILHENTTLKETLHQNNMAMKQQFHTLCLWQEEVLKVHQTHKERFEETKQLIAKLMTENKELRLKYEECKIQPDVKQLQTEKEELQKRLNEALHNLSVMTVKAQRKRSQSVKEKELGSVIEMLTKRLEIAERGRRQLEIDLDKIMFRKSRLEQRLAQKDTSDAIREQNVHILENTTLMDVFKRVTEFFDNTQRPARTEESEHESSCIDDLKEKIEIMKQEFMKEKSYCDQVLELLQAALSEYQDLTKSFNKSKSDKRLNIEAFNEKGSAESYDLLLAKVVSQDEELVLRNEQLQNLRSRVQALETENEAVQILKAQVSVYQSDFNIERKNREKLASERDRMLIEIQQLLKHNKKLVEEKEMYQSCQCPHLKRPVEDVPASATDISAHEKVGTGNLFCPNPECNMSFTMVGPLQVHVEKCLKLTD